MSQQPDSLDPTESRPDEPNQAPEDFQVEGPTVEGPGTDPSGQTEPRDEPPIGVSHERDEPLGEHESDPTADLPADAEPEGVDRRLDRE